METNIKTNKIKKYLVDFNVHIYRHIWRSENDNKKQNIQFEVILVLVFIFFFIIPVSSISNESTSKYSISMLGANIGEFSVTQTNENGNLTIEAITDVNVKLLFSYRVKYVQNTVYNHGVLQSSRVETYKNGKLNSTTWLKRQGSAYQLVTDGDTSIINDSITYSGSLVYFNEPAKITKIYKERSAEVMWISPASEHEYIVKDKKNKEVNRYYYEDGMLQYAKMQHTLGSMELKRIETNG